MTQRPTRLKALSRPTKAPEAHKCSRRPIGPNPARLRRPKIQHTGATAARDVQGSCASRFEKVREAFEQNFAVRREVGAAVAAWVDGELVVNLWAGTADAGGNRPWQVDTLATVLSGTKGLTST